MLPRGSNSASVQSINGCINDAGSLADASQLPLHCCWLPVKTHVIISAAMVTVPNFYHASASLRMHSTILLWLVFNQYILSQITAGKEGRL